jgi:hypothetical protein
VVCGPPRWSAGGRDQVGRMMAIAGAGITGAVRGRHRTSPPDPIGAARDTRTWSSVVGTPRPPLTSCGWRTSPMCGALAGFATWRSSSTCSPGRILGWRVSGSKQTALVLDAFRQAHDIRHRGELTWTPTGLIHHSDAGSQGRIQLVVATPRSRRCVVAKRKSRPAVRALRPPMRSPGRPPVNRREIQQRSGGRTLTGCPVRTPRLPAACRCRLARAGFATVAACHRSVWSQRRDATCRSRSVKSWRC